MKKITPYQRIKTAQIKNERIMHTSIKRTNKQLNGYMPLMIRMKYWNALDRLVAKGLVIDVNYPGKTLHRGDGKNIRLKPGYYSMDILRKTSCTKFNRG